MRIVQITNQTRNQLIGERIEVASTSLRRLFGLLGRRGVAPGSGLWIKPSSGVHTMGMLFPIDVVGLDRQRTVVRVWSHLRPFRVTAVSLKVHSVIELCAGQIAARNIQLGDVLTMQEAS